MKWLLEALTSTILVSVLSSAASARQTTTEAMLSAINVKGLKGGGDFKFGDKCEDSKQCGFEGSICDSVLKLCQCAPEFPVTNHLDKCGKAVSVNETCTFSEQCEQMVFQTECRDGRCACRFDKIPVTTKDGAVECQSKCWCEKNSKIRCRFDAPKPKESPHRVDPAMIGILAGMFLMFIILCVVLRLFSKARWRENRTIFNTPNPRLMNASLLQHNKSFHEGRRGSKTSARGPSRTTSVNSLRPHSPSVSIVAGSKNGGPRSRCNSRDGNESPPQEKSPTKGNLPALESVKVESEPLQRSSHLQENTPL